MRTASALVVSVLFALSVAPATAADTAEPRNGAPLVREQAPAAVAPNDTRPDEEKNPSGEMLDRWWEEDRVEHRDEQREERRNERYEADEPVIEDDSTADDTVETTPRHNDDDLDSDLERDGDT